MGRPKTLSEHQRWAEENGSTLHPWRRQARVVRASRAKLFERVRSWLPARRDELGVDPDILDSRALERIRDKYYWSLDADFDPAGEAVAGVAAAAHWGREECATVVDLWIEDGGLKGAIEAALAARNLTGARHGPSPGARVHVTEGREVLARGDTRRIRRLRERLCWADDAAYVPALRHAVALFGSEDAIGRCILAYLFPAGPELAEKEAEHELAPLEGLENSRWLANYEARCARTLLLLSLQSMDDVIRVGKETDGEVFAGDDRPITLVARHGNAALPLFSYFKDGVRPRSPKHWKDWVAALVPLDSLEAAHFALGAAGERDDATAVAKAYLLDRPRVAVPVVVDALVAAKGSRNFARGTLSELVELPGAHSALLEHLQRLPPSELKRLDLPKKLVPKASAPEPKKVAAKRSKASSARQRPAAPAAEIRRDGRQVISALSLDLEGKPSRRESLFIDVDDQGEETYVSVVLPRKANPGRTKVGKFYVTGGWFHEHLAWASTAGKNLEQLEGALAEVENVARLALARPADGDFSSAPLLVLAGFRTLSHFQSSAVRCQVQLGPKGTAVTLLTREGSSYYRDSEETLPAGATLRKVANAVRRLFKEHWAVKVAR